MNSVLIASFAIIIFLFGYRIYGKKIEKLLGIEPDKKTPAHLRYDGVDYVPAKHWTVLFGHHFASIAGAGPIIGPIIALAVWGWVPAVLWVIVGSIFVGGVHDFGSLMASVRHGGTSVGDIAEVLISKKAKIVYCAFVWFALILVIAVFIFICAKTLAVEPRIVVPTFGLIPVAVITGLLLYIFKLNHKLVTVLGLAAFAGLIILGNFLPVSIPSFPIITWSLILIGYCFIASVVPVQMLLQPRDYLSSYFLLFGLVSGYLGIILSHQNIKMEPFIAWNSELGYLWPMMFVSVACGAISGFHSLISSGTTSKQLSSEKEALKVSYGAMITEGAVAILAVLVVAAGLGKVELSAIMAKGGPIEAFGQGFKVTTNLIFRGYGGIIAITILNAFILTTLDTATRIGRYLTQELFGIKNRYLSTFIVLLLGGWLALSGHWNRIWPVFGSANQLVAALALMVISIWLLSRKIPIKYTAIPALFMFLTSTGALIFEGSRFIKTKEYLLVAISFVLLILSLFMVVEVIRIIRRRRWAT